MTRDPVVDLADLEAALAAWPGTDYDKARMQAVVLRIRIERLVTALPTTVISAPADSNYVQRRLLLSLGRPGLSYEQQAGRLRAIQAAVAAYAEICDLLHGKSPDPNPPLHDLEAWRRAVDRLVVEFM
jgi:hypothetical protein